MLGGVMGGGKVLLLDLMFVEVVIFRFTSLVRFMLSKDGSPPPPQNPLTDEDITVPKSTKKTKKSK